MVLMKCFLWFLETSGLYISWAPKIMLLEHFFGNVWASVQAPAGLALMKQKYRRFISGMTLFGVPGFLLCPSKVILSAH